MPRESQSKIGGRGERGAPPLTPIQWEPAGLVLSARSPLEVHFVRGRRDEARPEGAGAAWDMHLRLEAGVVLSGRMRRLYSSWQADLGAGQVWFCGVWERHGWELLTPRCEHLVITMLPGVLARSHLPEAPEWDWMAPFVVPPHTRPQARGKDCLRVLALVRRLLGLLDGSSHDTEGMLGVLLLELLLLLTRDWNPPVDRRREFRAEDFELVDRAVGIALGTKKSVSTQQAARACGWNYRAFSRAFSGIMGISFAKFALACRLSRSAADLRDSDWPVAEIARRWGFADPSSYVRSFSRHHGMTPTRYRRSHGVHHRARSAT